MSRQRTVLILGASRSYAGCIQAAVEMGHRVVAADRNSESYGFALAHEAYPVDISDSQGILALAGRINAEAIVPLNDYGVLPAATVAASLGLPGLDVQAAERAVSKLAMRRTWQKYGVPGPRFCCVTEPERAPAQAKEHVGPGPYVVKPVDSRGGGSRGVMRVEDAPVLPEAVAYAQSFYPERRVLVEECVEGSEHSLELLGRDGRFTVLAVGDKEKTPPPYRVDKSVIYPSRLAAADLERVCAVAVEAAMALGIRSNAVHVELCMTPHGPKLFELGARFGGGHTASHILPQVTGRNYLACLVSLLLGDDVAIPAPRKPRGCVYRFLTPPPGRVAQVTGVEEALSLDCILDAAVLVAPGDHVREVRIAHDRAGLLVAAGEDRSSALACADRAEALIGFVQT